MESHIITCNSSNAIICHQKQKIRADWDSFRDFFHDVPWNDIFNHPVHKCATEVSSWVKAGIEAFVTAQKY